jgi:2-amino-4-hydroxy-6-hydroxymethyldihydropteridine diphosphokinase
MDTIFIQDLRVDTVIGIYDWERRIRQTVRFDLEMDFDIRAAAAGDDIEKTLDYKAVAKRVIAFVEAAEFRLVETLAEQVAALILDEFDVGRVSVTADKHYALRGAGGVGVRIERKRVSLRAPLRASAVNCYVGVGSNIEPYRHIPHAIRLLRERFGEVTVSPVYECPAVGFDGADFLNLVVAFETEAGIPELLRTLRRIESDCGRVRGERTASRTMDLDLLLYGNTVADTDELRLPRADILRYAFVLKPLAEIAPEVRHPTEGRRFAELWAAFEASGQPLRRVEIETGAGRGGPATARDTP